MYSMNSAFILLFVVLSPLLRAHPGTGIVTDSKGNLYYTDLLHVWKIAGNGNKTIAVHNVHTHELFIDKNDDLFGEHLWYNGERADTWGHFVWCLRSNGILDTIIKPTAGFLENYSFVRDSQGNMYWTQRSKISRIKKISPGGTISTIAEGKFKNIRWMHSTPDGILYFIDLTDLYKIEGGKISLVTKNLHERTSAFEYGSLQHNVYGIWLDRQQNVYVAILGGQVVKKVNRTGDISNVYYSDGSWKPCSGVFDIQGNMWIMEVDISNEIRVIKIPENKLSNPPSAFRNVINQSKPLIIISILLLLLIGIGYSIFKKISRMYNGKLKIPVVNRFTT